MIPTHPISADLFQELRGKLLGIFVIPAEKQIPYWQTWKDRWEKIEKKGISLVLERWVYERRWSRLAGVNLRGGIPKLNKRRDNNGFRIY
jgi:hypothetical protein